MACTQIGDLQVEVHLLISNLLCIMLMPVFAQPCVLRLMRNGCREVQEPCAKLLSRIVARMATATASAITLAEHIRPIMSGLLQCLDLKIQSNPTQSAQGIEGLILQIFRLVGA